METGEFSCFPCTRDPPHALFCMLDSACIMHVPSCRPMLRVQPQRAPCQCACPSAHRPMHELVCAARVSHLLHDPTFSACTSHTSATRMHIVTRLVSMHNPQHASTYEPAHQHGQPHMHPASVHAPVVVDPCAQACACSARWPPACTSSPTS